RAVVALGSPVGWLQACGFIVVFDGRGEVGLVHPHRGAVVVTSCVTRQQRNEAVEIGKRTVELPRTLKCEPAIVECGGIAAVDGDRLVEVDNGTVELTLAEQRASTRVVERR